MSEPSEGGHVETVEISRCGFWHRGEDDDAMSCEGDETGCSFCTTPYEDGGAPAPGGFRTMVEWDLDQMDEELSEEEKERWREKPFATEISHGEFLRQYGRCPRQCRVAEQIEIDEETDRGTARPRA